ncbi:MAG: GNAT family N-acetyltransferase [bacterium]|nr:GNAT family N-acetyltransferase [bacterium]
MTFPLDAGPVTLRPWRESDHSVLIEEANSRAVWRNLLHQFPHPYTVEDATEWIDYCLAQDPVRDLVIARDDRLIGVCGASPGEGVNQYTATVGYWIGEAHWGKGFASDALSRFVGYVWDTFDVERLQAEVFAWNPASARVLEKNGFVLEGTRRQAIHKDGEFVDEWFYSLLRSELRSE